MKPLAALKQVTDVEVMGRTPAFLEAHVLKACLLYTSPSPRD